MQTAWAQNSQYTAHLGPKFPICRPPGPKISNMPPTWAQNFQYAAHLGPKFPIHRPDHIKYTDHLLLSNIGPPM